MISELKINPEVLHPEIAFQTARSGGKGGQNVNKVETKVELRLDIPNSQALNEEQKEFLLKKLANKLTNEGVLILIHQTERSQLANKERVIRKFDRLIREAFVVPRRRRATRPTLASNRRRIQSKKQRSETKKMRRKPPRE
ncbi:alternative ribosome rescue aminoacyl-tRNA hydrolase ArfB [Persicitalea jodogahamensis]|uniref:Aminoacyl-tRNA hydrolase n=2 Tax=Persicitalea jodogahamensis TaxID=402147 RepID=A0A8J3D660_9BACT|nr:aminoacyl-tRNA hydrolase [Persicitalea jodogahamensis]